MSQPQISIIIVNHKSERILGDCLRAIDNSKGDIALEIIIVNNPPQADLDFSESCGCLSIKIIETKKRLGFAAANNIGVAHAEGEYLLLLNPDIALVKNALMNLLEAIQLKPHDIIVGRLMDKDGTFQPSCRKFPTLGNLFFSRGSIVTRLFGVKGDAYTLPDYENMAEVEAAAAAMMIMAKSTYERLGGFDESFFLYMEDTDLCYRHYLNGGKIYYNPNVTAFHLWGYSTGHYRFRRIIWHHLSVWKYFVKHYRSPGGILFLLPALFINCCLSLILELLSLRS